GAICDHCDRVPPITWYPPCGNPGSTAPPCGASLLTSPLLGSHGKLRLIAAVGCRQKKGAQPLRGWAPEARFFAGACREGSRHGRTTSSARRGALPMKSDVGRFCHKKYGGCLPISTARGQKN